MRPTLTRCWRALCAGRAPDQVALRILAAAAIGAVLWASSCAFLLLEGIRHA